MLKVSNQIFNFSLSQHFWFPFFFISLRLIPSTAELSYFLVAGYALLGRQQIIESLFLVWLFSMLNPEIIPYAKYESFSRYIVVLACLFSILIRANFKKIDKLCSITILLGIFFIFHSIFFSHLPLLSIMKATYWILIMVILILSWQGMSFSLHENTIDWITAFLFISILISLVLFQYFPEIGFTINNTYFQGILNHPQAMGLAAASLTILLIYQLDTKNKNNFLLFIKIIIAISLLLLSGSRTAVLAIVLSMFISVLLFSIYKLLKGRLLVKFHMNKFYILGGLFLLILMIIFQEKIFNLILIFVNKTYTLDIGNLLSAYKKSRSVLYDPMIDNISKNFYDGIGFGLASDLSSMNIKYFKGIPVSAPTEKGILPLAILEEVGVYGLIIFTLWVLMLISLALKKGFRSLLVLLTILIFNFGESGFFSPNGFGMLYLILITSVVTGHHKFITSKTVF